MIKLSEVSQFFREVRVETKKVTYPSWTDTKATTGVVILVVVIIGVYLAIIDAFLSWVMSFVL